jgi:hypothetical protein
MSTRTLLLAALLLLLGLPLYSQVDRAAIDALAVDQSKAPIPGVTVTITRPETGYQQVSTTDAAGIARFKSLALGPYTVTFALEGFAPVKEQHVTLVVGQTARITAELQAAASESITVSAASPVVDIHKTDSSTNIVPEQLTSLPTPDRDFQRLTFLAPGVERERGAFRFITGGPVIGAGGNASQSTILVDGVDFTDPALGLSRTRFSQDAIREFRVIQNRFDTEIGGSSGGALSIVTKSGTNELHGNAFGFWRDNALRAKPAGALTNPDYNRHQFGATLGGPVVKDKLFFFASLEQVSETATAFFRPGGAYASTAADIEHPFDQTLVFGSMDDQINERNSARGSLVYEKWDEDNFRVGGFADQSYGQQLQRKNWNATAVESAVLSTNATNELHAQYGSHKYDEPPNSSAVAEWFSSGNTLMTGENILGDLLGSGTTYELRDTYYHHFTTGKTSHEIKAGGSLQHVNERSRIDTYANGLFIYVTDTRALPLAYAYGVGSSDVRTSTNVYGAFLEDSWSVTPKLTINGGLRYDLDTNGNNAGFTHPLFTGERKRDSNNWQPRASFSYDLGGDGQNVVRGGAGRFTGRFLLVPALQELQQNGVTGRVTYTRINGALLGIPSLALDPAHPTTTGIVSKPAIILLAPDYEAPESDQYSLGWTGRLAQSRLFFDAEGIYVKGNKEIVIRDVNWSGNATHVRPNTAYDQINMYTNDGHSKYQALVFSLNGNIRKNDLITTSVTFANKRNISDDFSPEFPTGYPNDPANIEAEYGRGRGTERFRAVLSGIFHMPWAVTVAPIYEYGSGQPWTHRLGYDFNGDGKNSDRPAGVGRFTMDGPAFRQFSLRVTKGIPAGGWGQIEAIAEAFNLTNIKNWDAASINGAEFLSGPTIGNPTAAAVRNPNYGKPSAPLSPREIQLGLRWVF